MNLKWDRKTDTLDDTWELAAALYRELQPGTVLALYGELGAGKTAFVQGLAQAMGIQGSGYQPHVYHHSGVPGKTSALSC